jgi:outer membrane immunogenic protein
MIRMKALLLSAALVGGSSSFASAADLPVAEPAPIAVPGFSWTGFYVGAQAGYGWGKTKADVPLLGGLNFKPKGGVFGAFAGYKVQLDNSPLVLGVETDFNYADQDGKRTLFSVPGLLSLTGDSKVRWTGATRARVGVAFDRVLVYGTAGVAYARRTAEAGLNVPVIGLTATVKDTKWSVGWTVGGGVEYAVTDNILARVDYRYSDFGKDRFRLGPATVRTDLKEHRVMAGLAYKFNW